MSEDELEVEDFPLEEEGEVSLSEGEHKPLFCLFSLFCEIFIRFPIQFSSQLTKKNLCKILEFGRGRAAVAAHNADGVA